MNQNVNVNKTNFQYPGLALKQRWRATWKWAIENLKLVHWKPMLVSKIKGWTWSSCSCFIVSSTWKSVCPLLPKSSLFDKLSIGLLQQWVRWYTGVVTPKMMCNHNIITRNEKNRSKLLILQSFSILCYMYIFKKWKHFQITKFNRVYMAGGQALPSTNFFPYKFWALNCHQILYFNATDPKLSSSTYFSCPFHF